MNPITARQLFKSPSQAKRAFLRLPPPPPPRPARARAVPCAWGRDGGVTDPCSWPSSIGNGAGKEGKGRFGEGGEVPGPESAGNFGAALPPPLPPPSKLSPFGCDDIQKQTFRVTQNRNRNRNRAPTTRTAGSSAAGVVVGWGGM
jgi:hypothetical protein